MTMATPNLESTNSSNALTTQKKNSSTALKAYGKVVISLENCLLPDEKRNETPSMKDGLSWENEMELRLIGCEFIQHAGILLRLPQVAMATGQVLFQRFYYTKSFIKQNMEVSAMACVCLASKIEESPRRPRDVCNVFHHIKQVLGGKTIAPLPLDSDYITLKNQVIKAERRVLKELGFCVHVKHPHKMIVTMLQLLESSENQVLTQQSWNYMNDSLRTDVFMRYAPETIACACIYLSAAKLNIPLPNKPAWYLLFDATGEQVQKISRKILQLYSRLKPNLEKLEKIVNDIKAEQQQTKMKMKGLSGTNTPTTQGFSPGSRQGSPKINNIDNEKKELKNETSVNGNGLNSKDVSNHAPAKHDNSRSSSESSKERKDRSRSSSLTPRKRKKYEISPPRSYKEHRHHHRQRKSRSRSREKKENRHKMEKKRHRSRSVSISPPYKKSKEYRNRHKSRSYSRSPVRHEKSRRTSRKERSRDHRRSDSRERSRR